MDWKQKVWNFVFVAFVLAALVMGVIWGEASMEEAATRGSDDSILGHVFMWGIGFIVSAWKIVNWPTNWILGDNLFDLVFEVMMLVVFVTLMAGIVSIPMKLGARIFRRRVAFKLVWLIVLVALAVPHFYMSWSLREYKREFKERAMGPSGVAEYATYDSSGELSYGGRLDNLVGARVVTLGQNQYVPYFTAYWRTNGIITVVGGAYIYTFLPKETYDHALFETLAFFSDFKTPKEKEKARAEFTALLEKPIPVLR